VNQSAKPADERHRYGHGKFENIAGIIEALLIVVAAVMIILNAIPKLFGKAELHSLTLGAVVMAISALVNFFVSRRLMQVARQTESPALAADAWHLRTDVYTSLGVFLGIAAIRLTGLTILDPIIALAVSILILKAAYDLLKDSVSSILDVCLPESEEREICDIINSYADEFVEFHDFRTRRAGPDRYVDLHLVVPRYSEIKKVHFLCDKIEKDINDRFPGIHMMIHIEPCGQDCRECRKEINSESLELICKQVCNECDRCKEKNF